MANKRHKPEEIVTKLRQVEVLVGQGMSRVDAIREVRITEQTFYRWRKQYGGMGTDQLKELKRLQKENERLRKAVSDLTLDKLILTEAVEQRGGHFGVAKDAGPFAEGEVGGDDDRSTFVELADQMEQELAAGLGEWQIAKLVQDQEVEAGDEIGGSALA